MNFRQFVESVQTKLSVFDFDKTLANSPERPPDWRTNEKKRADWWTHADSLSPPLYDGSFNELVLKAFLAAKSDPNTKVVMLTGRDGVMASSMVRQHLRNQGLYGKRVIAPSNPAAVQTHTDAHPLDDTGHEEYYKGDFRTEPDYPKNKNGKPSVDTLDHKKYIIQRLLHPGIREIEFWDDREEHLPEFLSFFKDLIKKYPIQVTVHHVQGNTIKTINVNS